MKRKHLFLILICLTIFHSNGFSSINSVKELTNRIIPKFADKFEFELGSGKGNNDYFEIESKNDKILITGNNSVSLTRGLNHYLKEICNVSISWNSNNLKSISKLQKFKYKIHVESIYTYRYYLNYCTYDYSMMGWGWERWEKEIDWMALQGVNLALTGIYDQYAVWQNTLRRIGFTEQEIFSFLPGLGYEAWWLMGNLEGFGGPISQNFINDRTNLQLKILNRMRELDIEPIYQGFYGMVPNSFIQKNKNCHILNQGLWGVQKRPAMLDPEDSCFKQIASIYYEEQGKLFGKAKFYGGDPFHEGGNLEGINIKNSAINIYKLMSERGGPDTKWILQGWWENPRRELLEGLKKGQAIVLDLMADETPQWGGVKESKRHRPEGYLDHQWIWCALPNFGGRIGMHGKLSSYISGAFDAKSNPQGKNICGIGTAPEGIGTNPIVYDMIYDMAWDSRKTNVDDWINDYIKYRYHTNNRKLIKAWELLGHSVFECKNQVGGPMESFIRVRPADKIDTISGWGSAEQFYNPKKIIEAWNLFYQTRKQFNSSETFQEDFVNLTRQVLSDYSRILHVNAMKAFTKKDVRKFNDYANRFLNLIEDEDELLCTRKEFLLGSWINSAKSQGTNEKEETLFTQNAKMLVTTWGNTNSGLRDYANREWAGLLKDFYYPRWQAYFHFKKEQLMGISAQEPDYFAMEMKWVNGKKDYPAKTTGNASKNIEKLYSKYYKEINNCYK